MGHKSDAPLEEPHALTTPTVEEGLGGLVLALLRGEYMWSLAASSENLTTNYEERRSKCPRDFIQNRKQAKNRK